MNNIRDSILARSLFAAVIGVFLPSLFSSAAENKEAPTWINGDKGRYQSSEYLSAVGTGESRTQAETDAKRGLSEIFRSSISSSTEKNKHYTAEKTDSNSATEKSSTDLKTNVTVKSATELRGAEVAESYFDEGRKIHYVLAVIDKTAARTSYSGELERISEKTRSMWDTFKRTPKIALGNEILSLTQKFEALNTDYAVVNDGKGQTSAIDAGAQEKIRTTIAELSNKNTVSLNLSGPHEELLNLIEECLSAKHAKIARSAQQKKTAGYKIQLKETQSEMPMQLEGWVKYKFLVTAEVASRGSLVAKANVSKVESGRNPEQCFEKVKSDLSEEICGKISQSLAK